MISNLMQQIGFSKNATVDSDLVRHMILNTLRSYRVKFHNEYGELIICCDDKNYWRREIFEFYKKNRKQEREASKYNWDDVFSALNKIRDEVKENLPYQVLQVRGAEADDIVASICNYNSRKDNPERMLILSADKDFIQLHKYDFVSQYDPIRNRWIEHENPVEYLQEHIIRGDRSDGIPNILTCDDAIVTGKPQKKMSKEKIAGLAKLDPSEFTNYIRLRNWNRNSQLIDFTRIPEPIVERILTHYHKTRARAEVNLDYFITNNIQDLIEDFS